jgi:DNA mismatch repair protein MutL
MGAAAGERATSTPTMAERLIHILPEQVASQIAAGEVVERPASAAKELVENALDAGARTIAIAIERGGIALIAVTDDGAGMGREDAVLSLRRHATSKIRDASDLAAIRTLGFRGEALASIASVSRLRLRTRRAEDGAGIELNADGGEIGGSSACAMAPGTQIEVRDLFFNTPARRKFLKTDATEQGAVAEAVQRLALANCAVAFSLSVDGRTLLELPRASSVLERARQLFGPKLAAQMLAFELARDGVRVRGLAAISQESFATARMVFAFVNGRTVRDRLLARAIAQAYANLLPRGRHPAAAVFIDVRPEDVDVNVHPMKTEVRFRRPGAIFEAVYHALRERLADQTGISASAGAATSATAARAANPAAAPAEGTEAPAAAETVPAPPRVDQARVRVLRLVADSESRAAPAALQRPLGLGFDRAGGDVAAPPATPGGSVPMYSQLRVIGQLFAGYIALESDDGLILVDQHAAHERVTFERLRAQLRDGGITVQPMLTAQTVELNPARAAQIQGALPELRALGFDIDPFGPAALLLKGTPAVFGAGGGARLLADMIESMGESGWRHGGESALDGMLKQLACHGSVRAGRVLEPAEIHALLADLDRTEFKTNCPHGRPVHIRFARGQIERMFRR